MALHRFEKKKPLSPVDWLISGPFLLAWLIITTLKFISTVLFWILAAILIAELYLMALFVARWIELSVKEGEWPLGRFTWWPKIFGWQIWPIWPLDLFFFYNQKAELLDPYFWLWGGIPLLFTPIFFFFLERRHSRK